MFTPFRALTACAGFDVLVRHDTVGRGVMVPHGGEDTGMSMLARARSFLVRYFSLLFSRRAQISAQEQS